MRILWNELKKILTWKMLLLLVTVNGIMYFLFIEFYITHFPNGRPELDNYNISIEMLEKYGAEMAGNHFIDFKETYADEIKKVDDYLQTKEELVENGILTYEDTRYKVGEEVTEEVDRLRWQLLYDSEIGDTLWELQEREYIIESIEDKYNFEAYFYSELNAAQQIRVDELKENEQFPSLPNTVMDNFQLFIKNVAITIFISVVIVISPIFLKDRVAQIDVLQYTAKKGRKLFQIKIAAGLLATFLVISGLICIYFSMYKFNQTQMFFDLPVHKFIGVISWYDPTFFQYILLTIIGIYLLGFVSTFFSMGLSNLVPNYISLIGLQIPYLFLLILVGANFLINWIISIYFPQWLVPTAYGLLLVASIGFILLTWKREMKRDITL